MKYFYLTFQQIIILGSFLLALGIFWMEGLHDFGTLETASAVCGVVLGGLFLENLGEGFKRAGKKVFYTPKKVALKTMFIGIFSTIGLLYLCQIPYNQIFLVYGTMIGLFATLYKEYQVRQARGLKIHFDVTLLNDGTYSIGTNSTTTEVQDGVRDLSAQRLQDPKELVGKLHTILGTYENRSPEDDSKELEVTIDRMRV